MSGERVLKVIISGDAKGALAAFGQTEAAAGGMSGKLAGFATSAAGIGVGVAAAAVAVGVGLFKIGSNFDEAYDKIRVGTGATGEQLESLKDSFKTVASNVPNDFGQVSDAITQVNQKLGLTGAPLEAFSTQMLNLSRITDTDVSENLKSATDVINNWGISAADQGAKMDELFRASQKTGVGFGELAGQVSTQGVKFRELGFTFEDTTALLATLSKNGVDAGPVLSGLGKAMATAAKDGKPAAEVVRDTFAAIQGAPTSTEAANKAMEVFGAKAGPQLAALIREGKLSYEELAASLANGDTINKAAADTEDFAEKWDRFKNKTLVALEPIATKVFDAIGQAMDKIAPIVEELSGAIGKDGLAGAFEWLKTKFEQLSGPGKAIAIILGAIAIATIAATAPWLLIAAAIGGVVAGVVYAYQHFEGFRNVIDAVADFLVNVAWPAIQQFAQFVGQQFEHLVAWVQRIWPKVSEAIGHVMNVIMMIVTPILDGLKMAWSMFGDNILAMVRIAWDYVRQTIENAINIIRNVLELVLNVINGDWSAAWENIKGIVGAVWNQIGNIVSTALAFLGGIIGAAWELIKAGVSAAWEGITGALSAAWEGIKTAAGNAVGAVIGFFTGLPGAILGIVGTVASAAASVGSSIISGIMGGLQGVFGFIGDLASSVLNAIKTAVNTVIDLLNDAIPNALSAGPLSIDLPDNPIPRLAEGGIVTRPTLALIGEDGAEAVIPLSGRNRVPGVGTSIVNNFYGTSISADDVGREVLWRLRTG